MSPVRFSHLRAYGRSAMHGNHARTRQEKGPTADMELGTAVHALVFGTQRIVSYPGTARRGKEYETFSALHKDALILTGSNYAKAHAMADAVITNKVAAQYLVGRFEETIIFKWNGMDCRATPDVRGKGFLTELKTSASSDPAKFLWHARRMAYHAQMRYQEYACEALKEKINHHWIVCIENDAPHPVTVFHVEPEALVEGDKLLMLWSERLKNSEASNEFPGYIDCPVPLVWPKDEFTLEYEEAA